MTGAEVDVVMTTNSSCVYDRRRKLQKSKDASYQKLPRSDGTRSSVMKKSSRNK